MGPTVGVFGGIDQLFRTILRRRLRTKCLERRMANDGRGRTRRASHTYEQSAHPPQTTEPKYLPPASYGLAPADLTLPHPQPPPGEDFVGTTRTADGVECSLGRLAFNIFEPVELPVLITEFRNNIGPRPEGAEPTDVSSYDLDTRWVARDGSGLKGLLEIEGECWQDPSKPEKQIMVRWLAEHAFIDDAFYR